MLTDYTVNIIFHYPPELLSLLIDTIPALCRSKKDTLLFFQGAGVGTDLTNDLAVRVAQDPNSIRKYEIARVVLTRLNEKGEPTLRERREVLKRVIEFEDFSACWPDDQLRAKGLVSEIRRVVNVKDSFTRMHKEREEERKKRQAEQHARLQEVEQKRAKLAAVKTDLFALFREPNSQKRGRMLEGVLNRLFEASGILVREEFTLKGNQAEGVLEQIDGIVEIDGELYLVEMKWWKDPLGTSDVSPHLVKIFTRGGQARGIMISYSDYTEPALATCRDAFNRGAVVVLCRLKEIVDLLDQEGDLRDFLREKIHAAIIDKKPFSEASGGSIS